MTAQRATTSAGSPAAPTWSVGRRGDRFERDADRVAAETVEAAGLTPQAVRPDGTLAADARDRLEPLLRFDFSRIRIHADAASADASTALAARAFTTGTDIHFGAGQLDLSSPAGRRLLVHELAHTVQQGTDTHAPALQKAETDDGPPARLAGLPDGAAALNREVNTRIAAARSAVPGTAPASNLIVEVFRRLGEDSGLGFLSRIEGWANTSLPHVGGGFGSTAGTRYARLPANMTSRLGMLAGGPGGGMFSYLAPVVRLGSVRCGTDKIGHMFQQGFQYYVIARGPAPTTATGFGSRLGAGAGTDTAQAWGEWMEGIQTPAHRANPTVQRNLRALSALPATSTGVTGQREGHFGLRSTGVGSRGDLAANAAGLRFYDDLAANPRGYQFDILRYVTAAWNEQVSGNVYSPTVARAVRAAGRFNPTDTVAGPTGFPMP